MTFFENWEDLLFLMKKLDIFSQKTEEKLLLSLLHGQLMPRVQVMFVQVMTNLWNISGSDMDNIFDLVALLTINM